MKKKLPATTIAAVFSVLFSAGAFAAQTIYIHAHRGEPHLAPQNTPESISLAFELGARMIETDFHLTKDGTIVCMHMRKELRDIWGIDKEPKDLTIGEIRASKLAHPEKFDKRYANCKIPTIDDIFAIIPKDKSFELEIKTYGDGFADKVEAARKKAGLGYKNILITNKLCARGHQGLQGKISAIRNAPDCLMPPKGQTCGKGDYKKGEIRESVAGCNRQLQEARQGVHKGNSGRGIQGRPLAGRKPQRPRHCRKARRRPRVLKLLRQAPRRLQAHKRAEHGINHDAKKIAKRKRGKIFRVFFAGVGVRNKPEKIGMRKLPPCRDVGKTPRNAADKRLPFSRAKNFGKQSRKTFAPRLQKPAAQKP